MPKSKPRRQKCTEPGCKKFAVGDSKRCAQHQAPQPAEVDEPHLPAPLPDNPGIDDLIASLKDRLAAVDAYIQQHEDDLKAQSLAADITTRIGRLIRDRARLSSDEASSIAQLLSRAVDLLLDEE